MPTYIRIEDGRARLAEDAFSHVADDIADLETGGVILSLARFEAEGDRLISEGRRVGVRLASDEQVEALAYDLPRISLVALDFPKFRDGRAYTNARLLRERLGFKGEVRAVGDVLREQAGFMLRVGFDAFEPADGSNAQEWDAALRRYRHVYQRAADGRAPAFAERER
ncbi:DUF934 domain-containing protein [Phenylobacterium sp. J367]|uniref:DUF934 domain-containing protein n=1 Tax=Phenylobacterium sp. J367 TaxID=2898435 RepID=UPI0021516314|nr:DUF934 domain-containing protein [Phenylobacterium sp. J367]MCR5879784.1 DUF934 domain-containing protein [Phenylobacterium sp. J367]